jgi:hypothetical protein
MPPSPDHVQPYEGDEPYLFISYSRKDLDSVQPVLQALAERGVRLWWDLGLHAGEDYGDRLEQRVDASAGLVVFLSAHSTKKKSQNWVLSETKHAAEGGKEIVPVMLQECALPLEWKALVEHRQIVALGRTGVESVVQGILGRAKALVCVRAQEATLSVPKKVEKAKEVKKRPAKDAWLQGCTDAMDQLQQILGSLFPTTEDEQDSAAPWDTEFDYGDEADEPPDIAINFPLKVDTDDRYSRCRELVAAADDSLDLSLPISERLTNCLRVTEKVPGAKEHAPNHLALGLCHLYHLIILVRIHADAREAPGAETINRLNRASALMTGTDHHARQSAVYEVLRLVQLNLDIARLELALIAGLPDSKSLALAKTKGILAYSDEWRTRIISAEKLEQELWCYTTTKGDWTCTIAKAFHSAWTLGEWITCCYRDLMQPGAFGALPGPRPDSDERMHRRGAERAIDARLQIGWNINMHNLAETGELLSHCYRPPLERGWGRKPIQRETQAMFWLNQASRSIGTDQAEFSRCLRSHNCCLLLASLLLHPASGLLGQPEPQKQIERDLLVNQLGRQCVRRGLKGRKYWRPSAWMSDDRLRVMLWAESRRAMLEGARHAEDVLFLAGECDPSREMITLAKSHFFFTPPEQRSRVAEILAQPDAANLRRAGWLPGRFYQARSERVPDDLRALLS